MGPLTLNSVTANMGKRGEYSSGYYDLPDRTVTVSDDEFFDLVYQNTLSQGKGTMLAKRPFVITSPNGFTVNALEVEFQFDAQTTSIRRVYWVKGRSTVYMNVATFQRSTKNFESAERFLDSFQLVTQ